MLGGVDEGWGWGGVRGVRGGSEDEGSEGRGVLEGVERC